MKKTFSTVIIPETSEGLLFSVMTSDKIVHCWYNEKKAKYVLLLEYRDHECIEGTRFCNFNSLEQVMVFIKNGDESGSNDKGDLRDLYMNSEPLFLSPDFMKYYYMELNTLYPNAEGKTAHNFQGWMVYFERHKNRRD